MQQIGHADDELVRLDAARRQRFATREGEQTLRQDSGTPRAGHRTVGRTPLDPK